MRKYHHALLAGAAALAIAAGTGLASAQMQTNSGAMGAEHGHAASQSSDQGGTHLHRQGKAKTGSIVKNRHSGTAGVRAESNAKTGANANAKAKHGKLGVAQGTTTNSGVSAEGSRQSARSRTENGASVAQQNGNATHNQAQDAGPNNRANHVATNSAQQHRRHPMRGLRANASNEMKGRVETRPGVNVRLNTNQRTRIRRTIIESRSAPRASHVDFDVRVGTTIPRAEITTIHVVRVPRYLVEIEPRWRDYEYFVYRREVIIVNPHTLDIVAIIPA
jgi:hypothetical protein